MCRTATARNDNVEVKARAFGARPTMNSAREHYDLGEALGMMDFERAAKVSGSRFVYLTSGLARLERAIANFMLDLHTGEFGYTEVAAATAGARRCVFRHQAKCQNSRTINSGRIAASEAFACLQSSKSGAEYDMDSVFTNQRAAMA